MQFGQPGQSKGSNDTENFGRVAKIFVDPKENEAYIADGYGNKRVAVIDADTGKFKRYWGAYGNKPDDTNLGRTTRTRRRRSSSARRCTAPNCRTTASCTSAIAPNDRIQVFTQGRHVREGEVHREARRSATARCGTSRSRRIRSRSTCTSPTARTRRSTSSIASRSRSSRASATAGASPASSSPSTASRPIRRETSTRRRPTRDGALQKFVYKGIAPVTKLDQGTVWPK